MDPKSVTIVTGGGRGIGRAIALRMARETAVLVVGLKPSNLMTVCREIEAAGGVADWQAGDVADLKTAGCAFAHCVRRGWKIANLVCNAGVAKSSPFVLYDQELWNWIMDVNIGGTFHFIKVFLPSMLAARQGTVVVISSVSGLVGSNQNAAYVASKHAQVGMVRALAREHGKDGVVTIGICPGYVETEMTERSIKKRAERHGISEAEARIEIEKTNPQRRIIPAEEVAEAVAFACSGKVPSLSGGMLVLSGGA